MIIVLHVNGQKAEYVVKSALLEKFTKYVEWPEECNMNNTQEPFVISVLGENPFEKTLETTYTSKRILNKQVKINYIKNISEIQGCHILFISESESHQLTQILSYTKKYPILIVGDNENYGLRGVHINLYLTADETIHFEINLKAVKESKLKISTLLLDYAKIIK
jgi:hypothetical protein